MKAWDIYDPQYVGAVWRRSFVDPFKNEILSVCFLVKAHAMMIHVFFLGS